ncbi:MAG TPA: LysR family transcriptional regulator [Alphaproteobacteria bacterium]|nr:LysR family transcriptional regulator [Alphaproteobacteria bacterium]
MELQQVRYFIALSKTLNFTRAAEECNVTQPALTRAIQALEAELGGELIRRERQLTHLTELGQRMLPLMQKCYDAAVSAKALAAAVKTKEVAALSIVVSPTINTALFSGALAELAMAFPGMQLKLRRTSRDEIARLLKDGEVELAVAGPIEQWDRLDSWMLFAEPFEAVLNKSHRLGAGDEISIDQLAGERLLIRSDCEMTQALTDRLNEKGLDTSQAHQLETEGDMIILLSSNLGVAITTSSQLKSELLKHLRLSDFEFERPITVYGVAGRRRSPVATALLNLLRATDWTSRAA